PAASSTPFVATLVDVTGIVIYFTLAMSILGGTILANRTGATKQFTLPTGERYVVYTDPKGQVDSVAPMQQPEQRIFFQDYVAPVTPPAQSP
ncbi:MAG: hypothetical protein MUE97_04585, partial [Phycisphaerales bacterium]|nr:hypothetical protein [Phycisphaerales bacterium]